MGINNHYWSPDRYLSAWNFAAAAHGDQKVPGSDIPYINHIGSVAMEVMNAVARSDRGVLDPNLAVQCALLHDVIEDSSVGIEEIRDRFGAAVADGVLALTKDLSIPKKDQMRESLERIAQQPYEVWMVKMADRITNLQPPPPHWSMAKTRAYREEARLILERLGHANPTLATRLEEKILHYETDHRKERSR